jgi:hypothetical protein
MAMLRFVSLGLALCLVACKPPAPTVDKDADPIARQFFEEVRTGADIEADSHMARELKNPTSEEQIAEFRTLIPNDPASQIETRSADAQISSTGTLTRLTQVYHYIDRTLLVQTALFKSPSGDEPVIVGFKVSLDDGTGAPTNAGS